MDDSLAVRMVERIRDLDREPQDLIERQRTPDQALGQRGRLQVLEHEEVDTAFVSDVEERADMGMLQTGDCAGFPIEALAPRWVLRQVGRQHLESDCATE